MKLRSRPTAMEEDIVVMPPKKAHPGSHARAPTPPSTGARLKPNAAATTMRVPQQLGSEPFSRACDSWDFEKLQGFTFKPAGGLQSSGSRTKAVLSGDKFGGKGLGEKTLPRVNSLPSIAPVRAPALGYCDAQAVLQMGGPHQRFF